MKLLSLIQLTTLTIRNWLAGKAVHLQLAAPSFEIDWQKVADAVPQEHGQ